MAKVIAFEVEIRGIKSAVTNQGSLTAAIKETKREIQTTDFGTKKYERLDKQLAELRGTQNAVRRETRDQAKAFEVAANSGERSYRQLALTLRQLEDQFKDLSEQERRSARGRELARKVRNLREEVRDLNSELGKKGLSGAFNEAFQNLGGIDVTRLATVGGAIALAAEGIRELGRFVGDSVQTFADYNRQISVLGAVSAASAEELDQLNSLARELGETTQFSASQVAQLEIEFAKLGFRPAEILAVTADTLNLATVAGTELGDTASVVASTIRAFGLDVSETRRITDVAAKSFSSTALDLEKFSVAVSTVAPVAAAANVEVEDTVALLGVLIDAGLDASTAGTGLRNVFLDIAAEGMTLEEALSQIREATDSNVAALDLFGKRGATVGTILANNTQRVAELGQTLRDSEGFAKEAAGTIAGDFQGSLDVLNSTLEGLKLNLIETFQGAAQLAISAITQLIAGISSFLVLLRSLPEFLEENKTEIIALGVAILGLNGAAIQANATLLISRARTLALTAVQRGAAIATGIWTAAQRGLNTALRTNPIGLVITAIGLIVAAIAQAAKRSETFRARLQGLGAVAKELFEIVKEAFGAFIDTFRQLSEGNIRGAISSFTTVLTKSNPISLAVLEGGRLADAYREGYENSINQEPLDAPQVDAISGETFNNITEELEELEEKTKDTTSELEKLRAKLKVLKEELEDEEEGTKRYERLKKEIQETEAAIKRLTGSTDSAKKSIDDAAAATDAFATGSVAQLRGEIQTLRQDLERAAPEDVPNILKKLVDAEEALDEVEEFQTKLREALTAEDRTINLQPIQARDILPDPEAIPLEAILQRIDRIKEERIAAAREVAETAEEFENQRRLIELQAEQAATRARIQEAEDGTTERLRLEQELADRTIAIQQEKTRQLVELERQRQQQVEEIQDTIFSGLETAIENTADASERRAESEIDALEQRYEREIQLAQGNTRRQEELEQELEQERQAIREREFERQKEFQVAAALTSLAQGIINTLAAPTTIPDPFSAAFKAVRIGILTATAANQIANIQAQTAQEGVLVEPMIDAITTGKIINGRLIGQTHLGSKGGIPMRIHGQPIIAEHGEHIDTDERGAVAIVNKRSAQRFRKELAAVRGQAFEGKRDWLSSINNYKNWGIPYAAQGAILEPSVSAIVNSARMTSTGSAQAIAANVSEETGEMIATMTAEAVRRATAEGIAIGLNDANRRMERESLVNQRTGR